MGLQASDIQHFLQEGATLPASSVLADAVETHPYAPLLHFLYLRSLQEEDSYKFPAQLHRTAVSTMHRQALLDWAEAPLIPVEVQAAAWQKKQPAESTPTMDQPPSAAPIVPDLSSEGEVPSLESVGVAPEVPAVPEAPAVPTSTPDRPSKSTTPSPSVPVPASSAPSSKPATTTKLADINLDALPPAVRAQVLRSRAIQAQWGKVSAQESTPEPKEFPAPEPPVSIPVAPEPAPTPEAATPPAPKGTLPTPVVGKSAPISDAGPLKEVRPQPTPAPTAVQSPTDASLSPFANFLLTLKHEVPTERMVEVPVSQRDPEMERAILEQFLQVNPKIKPVRNAPMGENLALRTPNVSGLVTETLANHYYDQGMHEKAIQAYEILKLKVPEKSAIFAARISEMRKIQSSTK
ncbi:MAG: hypothetical protein EBZ30_00080 [Flavobacteriia bacterium]|nr:hypothetical protein [Flavobacteriia bacterium]